MLVVPCLGAVASIALLGAPHASAATLTFRYNDSFGSVTPNGPAPYATSVFDDGESAGTVVLTMFVAATVGNADVTEMYFNLDPSLDPTSLVFTRLSGTGPTAASTAILLGVDAFVANGDGMYDIFFDLPSGNPDNSRFNDGEDLVYEISGIPTLTASAFFHLANPSGNFGPFRSVAMFIGTGGSGKDSDFVGAVPEPSSVVLAGFGLLSLLAFALRRWRRRLAV